MTWIKYEIANFVSIDEIYQRIWTLLTCGFKIINCNKSFQFQGPLVGLVTSSVLITKKMNLNLKKGTQVLEDKPFI